MKKFYFLMMALLVSVVANAADWYLVGGAFGWVDKAANKFEATAAANVLTKTVDQLSGTFKVKEAGTWKTSFGTNGQKLKADELYNAGTDTGDIKVDGTIDNATITINVAEHTILVTGESGETKISYDLLGNFDGSTHWSAITLQEKDGVWSATQEISACNFGIRELSNGNQSSWISSAGAAAVVLNTDIACKVEGTNFSITAGTYTFAFTPTAMTLKVTGEGGGDDPQPQPTNPFQLHGQITGNANWETIDLKKNETTGNWEYTGSFVAGEFGIREVDGSAYGKWIGGAATITEADKAYSFVDGVNSTSTLEGNFTFVYNPTAKTVTFVPAGDIEEVITYALRGTIIDGENWADAALTEKNGVWEATLDVVPGTFGIKKMINGAQKGWFSAPSEAEANVVDAGVYTAAGIGGTNWASTLEGKYIFSFNPETEVLTIYKDTVGIEAIEAEEGVEAVYYNLQGVRVANPENGMYIRVAGKTASKVYIR